MPVSDRKRLSPSAALAPVRRVAGVTALRVWGAGVLVADVWLLAAVQHHAFGSDARWYVLAACATLAAHASLLVVTSTRGAPALWAPPDWRWWALGLAAAAFLAGAWARGARLADFGMDAIPDMHRVLAVGADRLVRGEFPYQPVRVPWPTFMVYQPGLLLPYAVPAALGVDVRWAAVVASALVPALWIAVLGARGPGTLGILAPVALAWLLVPEQQALPAAIHDPAWWPWAVGGSLCFLQGMWAPAGLLWGLAAASRQYGAAVVLLFAAHLARREGWRPAVVFGGVAGAAACVLYLPFVLIDWRSVLVEPLRTYHEAMVRFVIPSHPEWIRESLGWAAWLRELPGYDRWVLPAQLGLTGLVIGGAVRWVHSRAGVVLCGGLALLLFNYLQDWPVWYLHIVPLLLIATATLEAACTSRDPRGDDEARAG